MKKIKSSVRPEPVEGFERNATQLQRYRITVAYDGTTYSGWQTQPNAKTIEQVLIDSFKKVFGQKPAFFLGASRTDAGVHAHGQTIMLETDIPIPLEKFGNAWNAQLPDDIVICDVQLVNASFHSHYSVINKTYHYHIFVKRPAPFVQRYGWYYRFALDIKKLEETLQVFVGTHDFRSFCTTDEDDVDTVRTIESVAVDFNKQLGAYRIAITGPKFLRYMIRRMVGAAVEVASRKDISIDYLRQVLQEKNAQQRLYKAPAQGLVLYKIKYK